MTVSVLVDFSDSNFGSLDALGGHLHVVAVEDACCRFSRQAIYYEDIYIFFYFFYFELARFAPIEVWCPRNSILIFLR